MSGSKKYHKKFTQTHRHINNYVTGSYIWELKHIKAHCKITANTMHIFIWIPTEQ